MHPICPPTLQYLEWFPLWAFWCLNVVMTLVDSHLLDINTQIHQTFLLLYLTNIIGLIFIITLSTLFGVQNETKVLMFLSCCLLGTQNICVNLNY